MEIQNPRRVLAVALSQSSHVLGRIVKDLTGAYPGSGSGFSESLSGITHPLTLKTSYYSVTIPVWLDLIGSPDDWASTFLTAEAKEVLSALGGMLVVFALPAGPDNGSTEEATRQLIRETGRVVKSGLGGWEWDGVTVAVGVGSASAASVEVWDECCAEAGLEFVHVSGKASSGTRNQFGEKTGIHRVLEALEANDWDAGAGDFASDQDSFGEFEQPFPRGEAGDDGLDLENTGLGLTGHDAAASRAALLEARDGDDGEQGDGAFGNGEGDQDEVEKVEGMMRRLHAVKEAGEGMPEDQRRRLAARAVADVMKEL